MADSRDHTLGFSDAKAWIKTIQLADQQAEREKMRECDWSDPEDFFIWRKQRNRQRREELLNKLVPNRKCPRCDEMKIGMRAWVISKNKRKAMCRSCYFRYIHNDRDRSKEKKYVDMVVFEKVLKYILNGHALTQSRKALKLSQREFGKLVGWSSQHQGALERGERQSIMEDKMDRLVSIFEVFLKDQDSIAIDDLLKGIVRRIEVRYKVHAQALSYVRNVANVSQAEFSRRAGYNDNVVTYLESGTVHTVSAEKRNILIKILSHQYGVETKD